MLDAIFTAGSEIDKGLLTDTYARLLSLNSRWKVELGARDGAGWLLGNSLRDASAGPFQDLLSRIQGRLDTADRKVVAPSFALRFGWSSVAAIAPYLMASCVPDVRLDNISLRFSSDGALFEQVSLHAPRASIGSSANGGALALLRAVLVEQATPVVDALHHWSRLPRKVLWGQVASSWSAQFELILTELGRAGEVLLEARRFFDAEGAAFAARPALYAVQHGGVTRVHHCRASCCLYYKVKPSSYCASCPLISEEERVSRNRALMEQLIARAP